MGGSADDCSGTVAVSSGSAAVMQEKTGAVEVEAAVRNSADTSSATAAVSSGSAAVIQEKTGAVEVEAAVRKARTALDNTVDDIQRHYTTVEVTSEFPVSSDHESIKSALKSIREDLELKTLLAVFISCKCGLPPIFMPLILKGDPSGVGIC